MKTAPPPLPPAIAPPAIADYTPAAISRAITRAGLKHPLTLYPMAIGAGSAFAGWLFAMPQLYLVAVAGIIGGLSWAVAQILIFRDKLGKRYLHGLRRRQTQYESAIKLRLRDQLQACRRIPGAADMADQGARQLPKIQEKLDNITHLLDLKLTQGELTHARFQGAAEQLCLSALDNLNQVAGLLNSAASIDPIYIDQQLAAMKPSPHLTDDERAARQALTDRLALRHEQFAKIKRRLAQNELAMTEMEKISAGIAEWQTQGQFAAAGFEPAITRLQELARQMHRYNP
jgi:predicted transcriptional regulator